MDEMKDMQAYKRRSRVCREKTGDEEKYIYIWAKKEKRHHQHKIACIQIEGKSPNDRWPVCGEEKHMWNSYVYLGISGYMGYGQIVVKLTNTNHRQ